MNFANFETAYRFLFVKVNKLFRTQLRCIHFQENSTITFNQRTRVCFFSSADRNMSFQVEKEKYLNLSLEAKRPEYRCKSAYVTLASIPTWAEYSSKVKQKNPASTEYSKNKALNEKVSLYVGDITTLEIDAIVNAANSGLKPGGGVCGAIHRAAGDNLQAECRSLNGCQTGDAKITGGYKLPAKYVIHAVGPMGEQPQLLSQCYRRVLELCAEAGARSVAFPCISTGIYMYPGEAAAHTALRTVRTFMEERPDTMDRVIFCLFLEEDVEIYESLMQQYFPV